MESKLATKRSSKGGRMKKAKKTTKSKKKSKTKSKTKDKPKAEIEKEKSSVSPIDSHRPKMSSTTFEELLQSHIYLYQYCNGMTEKIHEMEIELGTVYHQISFLRQENMEIKSLIQGLATRLKDINDRNSMDDLGAPPLPPREQKKEKPNQKKSLPLHDDVMMNCDVCNHVHHSNIKACPECGFDRNIKKRGDDGWLS